MPTNISRSTGVQIARHVRAAETAHDQALIEQFDLARRILTGRMEMAVGACFAQPALAEVARAINLSVESRAALVKAHANLAQAAEELEIRLDGPGEPKTKPVRPVLAA